MTTNEVITFRAPSGEGKATLVEIAEEQGETLSEFIRTAIVERSQRLAVEWVPTGDPTVDRGRMR